MTNEKKLVKAPHQFSSQELEAQLFALQRRFRGTPEKNGTKFNPRHFTLKNKIETLKTMVQQAKQHEFLAR